MAGKASICRRKIEYDTTQKSLSSIYSERSLQHAWQAEMPMCEMLALQTIQQGDTFLLAEVLLLAARLERLGIAGFGWGVAWHDPAAGRVQHHISLGALHQDLPAAIARLGDVRADAAIIHLRRPSQLSTIGLADTQPFYSERHGCAFAHNGDFTGHEALRPRYLEQGLLHGKADSEVGFRFFEEVLDRAIGTSQAEEALRQVYTALGGRANLLALLLDGSIAAYANSQDNWMFTCRLGPWKAIVTALYSWDQSVFDLVLPDAHSIRMMQPDEALTLRHGNTDAAQDHQQ
jgi:predicted glutamine amidotransferase